MKSSSRARGFTLIEIMVVALIIGILSATAMLSTVGLSHRSTKASAYVLLENIQQAWLWANINKQTTRVSFTDPGYDIQVWSGSSWQSPQRLLFTGHRDTHPEFSLNLKSDNFEMGDTIIFVAGGEYPAFSAELSFGDAQFDILGDGLNAPIFSDF